MKAALAEANKAALAHVPDPTISKNPAVAVWREAFQQFKTKKGARSSRINPNRLDIVKSPTVRMIPGMSSPLFNIVILIVKSDDSATAPKCPRMQRPMQLWG